MKPDLKRMQSAQSLRAVINKGIAYHHAGMLPDLKNVVEHLFAEGLIKVLYATETFAVGINMPAKTVCFNAVQKFDGISFRYFNSKEYFQMAGRAGRRGIDKEGTSIIVYDRRSDSLEKIRQFSEADREPIISQFKLSINTIINLINNHDDSEIETILKSNFDYFLRKQGSKQVRILASWNHKKRMLEKMGYVKNDELTEKGWFVRHIYANEILIAEIFATDLYKRLSDMEALLVVVAIAYEGRRGDRFYGIRKEFPTSDRIFKKLSNNQYVMKNLNKRHLNNVIRITKAWANGATFEELFEYSTLEEGDLIRLFRQSIDLLRQLKKASMTEELRQLASDSIAKLDRDVVKVEL